MNNFWKTFFGSALGSIVGIMAIGLIFLFGFFMLIGSVVSGSGEQTSKSIDKTSVLYLDLKYELNDKTNNDPFENISSGKISSTVKPGLYDLLSVLKHASSNDKITGIFLDISDITAGMAITEELRQGIVQFKNSGKFVYTYADVLTQKGFYLASAGDKIYLNPAGDVEFKGLSTTFLSFKGLLDKLGVKAEVFRPDGNKFKSAVEPFLLEKMSPENRAQTFQFLNTIWNSMLNDFSESRSISVEELGRIADELAMYNTYKAVELNMADSILYRDQFVDLLKAKSGLQAKDKLKLVSPGEYYEMYKAAMNTENKKDLIAVVFAEGEIVYGDGDNKTISDKNLGTQLKKAREDDKVKAVVLRVNSPGGSALASEILWREVELTKAKKPVIVSMGNYAASGGYYISCGANRIFADNSTLTGSIGVFGMLYNAQGFLNQKLGITTDTVKTNAYSDFFSFARNMENAEREYLNRSVTDVYKLFLQRVSEGRNLDLNYVDSIAQGRVWAGKDAINIGLVDEIGNLEAAINYAAKSVDLSDFGIKTLPEKTDFWQALLNDGKKDAVDVMVKKNLGEGYYILEGFRSLEQTKGVQARMPFNMEIK